MPHIVIGNLDRTETGIGAGNRLTDQYLGVWIRDAPDECLPGQSAEVTLILMYWPDLKYEAVVPGATFTVCAKAQT